MGENERSIEVKKERGMITNIKCNKLILIRINNGHKLQQIYKITKRAFTFSEILAYMRRQKNL